MSRKASVAIAVALVAIAGLALLAYGSLGLVVKYALERYGPEVTGVSFKVGEVSLSPRDGRGTLRGIEIGNPDGYASPRAAHLGAIDVALDRATLLEPVVVLHELAVVAPLVTYERLGKTNNLEAIQGNIQRHIDASGGPSSARPAEAKAGRRKFVIERLTIRGARVTMTGPALRGQGLTFDLPDVDLRDVGKSQGGMSASEIGHLVTGVILQKIAQKTLTSLELLRKGGLEGALDALKGLLK